MDEILRFVETNQDRFVEDLVEILKIPSVSAKNEHKPDMETCADHVANCFRNMGISNVSIYPTEGHPIVYAEWKELPGKPTVLIYGHYDVQPVDPLDEWFSPPFEPVIKDGQVYARGATDDKGQFYTHMKAIEAYLSTVKSLPVNIKVLVEGEEEVGSLNLYKFIENNLDLLSCDTILISDNPMFRKGVPSIGYGLRGLVYVEIVVKGPAHDLHSGTHGGAVPNPANVLMEIISNLKNSAGQIKIPGFYKEVLPLTEEERANITSLAFDDDAYCKSLDLPMVYGEHGYSTLERIWARPTLDVNGLFGGYMEEGAKTVLPAKATAKVSMRIVPNQTESKIFELFREYVHKICPPWVRIEIRNLHGGEPYLAPTGSPEMQAAYRALEQGFGVKPTFIREGGSIPVVNKFKKFLNINPVLIGYGLPDENTHAPNEHFDLDNYHKGILSNILLYQELGIS